MVQIKLLLHWQIIQILSSLSTGSLEGGTKAQKTPSSTVLVASLWTLFTVLTQHSCTRLLSVNSTQFKSVLHGYATKLTVACVAGYHVCNPQHHFLDFAFLPKSSNYLNSIIGQIHSSNIQTLYHEYLLVCFKRPYLVFSVLNWNYNGRQKQLRHLRKPRFSILKHLFYFICIQC